MLGIPFDAEDLGRGDCFDAAFDVDVAAHVGGDDGGDDHQIIGKIRSRDGLDDETGLMQGVEHQRADGLLVLTQAFDLKGVTDALGLMRLRGAPGVDGRADRPEHHVGEHDGGGPDCGGRFHAGAAQRADRRRRP